MTSRTSTRFTFASLETASLGTRPDTSRSRMARSVAACGRGRHGCGIALVVATLLFTGCAPLVTQSPGKGLSPVNVVSDGQDSRVMLKGHDVVAYFTDGTHKPGEPGIHSEYKGVQFRFASADHKALFDAAPEKFLPQYGGYCANGLVYGIPWGGDADTWKIVDGRLYIFGGRGSMDAFLLDVPGNIAMADKYWKDEVEGSNAFFQRAKRMVFRVPHYKSGETLAKAVAEARK